MSKHPGGRPCEYDPAYAEMLPDLFKEGESVIEVCVVLGIHKDTFYDWCKKYKEFSDAYALGLMYSEAWWQKLGRAGAAGGRVNPPMWRMNMMNRFGWREKIESEISIPDAPVGEGLTNKQKKELAKQFAEKLLKK